MCGRFTLFSDRHVIEDYFHTVLPVDFKPSYNIAPSQYTPVIREGPQGNQFAMMHWGLIPHWSKEKKLKYSTINARAETVAEKPAYRTPFKRTRCLVPSTGFYEWNDEGHKTKQPYLIQQSHNIIMAFAGLWDHWTDGEENIDSFSIIVTDANETIKPVHDRMPVILKPQDYDYWLSPDTDADDLKRLLVPVANEDVVLTPVSRHVNNPQNDDPACIVSVNR